MANADPRAQQAFGVGKRRGKRGGVWKGVGDVFREVSAAISEMTHRNYQKDDFLYMIVRPDHRGLCINVLVARNQRCRIGSAGAGTS